MVNKVASTQPIVNGSGRWLCHKKTGSACVLTQMIFFSLLTSCASNYERGSEALLSQDYATARSEADEGLQDDPDDGKLLGLMARALYGMDEFSSAIRFAELALATGELEGREQGDVHSAAGLSYAAQHDFLPAALHLATAHTAGVIENDPEMRQILLDGGLLALEGRRGEDSLRLFTLLYRLNETAQDARANQRVSPYLQDSVSLRADELLRASDSEAALQMLAGMVRDFPEIEGFEMTRGLVLLRLTRESDATTAFEQFVQASLDGGAAWETVALAVQSAGWHELAVRFFENAIAVDVRRHLAHAGRLETLLALERREDARLATQEWLGALEDPAFTAEAVLGAVAVWWEYDSDTGLDLLRVGAETLHNFEITQQLAAALRRRGQADEADALIAGYIEAGNPPAVAAEEVGDWYRSRSRFAVAAEYFSQAITGTPDPRELLLKLAETYSDAGWAFDMATTLEHYLERTGGERSASMRAVELLTRHAMWREVVEVLEPLQQDNPGEIQLVLRLGEALFNSSEPADEDTLYRRFFSAADDPGRTALRFAAVFAARGFYQASLAWLENASSQDDTRAEALLAMGIAHRRLGQTDEMWSHFELLIAEAADPIVAGFTILNALSDRAAAPIAVVLLERLIALSPGRLDLHRELVLRLAVLGDEAKLVSAGSRWVQLERTLESAEDLIWILRTRPNAAAEIISGLISADPEWASLNLAAGRIHLQLVRGALGSPQESARHRAAAQVFYENYVARGQYENLELLGAADTLLNHNLYDLATRYYQLALEEGFPAGPIRWPITVAMAHTDASDSDLIDRLSYTWEASETPLQTALDATDLFADQRRVRPAIAAARLVFRDAHLDSERSRVFERVASLMVDAGSVDLLLDMAWEYVDLSRDQVSALQVASSFLIRAGQYEDADEFLELALERTPGRSDLGLARAEIRLRNGQVSEARQIVAGMAGRSPSPWRQWEEYGHSCAEFGNYQEAARAYDSAVAAGGSAPSLLFDRATADLRIGETESAIECLGQAARAAAQPDADPIEAGAVTRGVVERLLVLGEIQLATDAVESALGSSGLQNEARLLAAKVALASGNERRAEQMIERAFTSGHDVLAALRLEVTHGLILGAREHLRQLVFEGDPATAQTALIEHADWIARDDLDTLEVWVEEVTARGQFDDRLLARLTAGRLRSGRLDAALTGLETLSATNYRYNFALIGLGASQRGAQVTYRALRNLLTDRELSESEMMLVGRSLATAGAMGNHREIQDVLSVLALDPALPQAIPLEIDWLLASGQGIEAVDRYTSISNTASTGVRTQSLAAFVRRGYNAEAAVLARDRSGDPQMELRAIEADLARNRDVEPAIEAYLERYSSQSLLVLGLGERLADRSRGSLASDVLSPLLGTSGQHSRAALRAAIRVSLTEAESETRRDALTTFVEASSLPREAHIDAAAALSEYGLDSEAADHLFSALAYTPHDPQLEIELFRSYFAAGRIEQIIASRSPFGGVRLISAAPVGALEQAVLGSEQAFFGYLRPHVAADGDDVMGWLSAEAAASGLSETRLAEVLSEAETDRALRFATLSSLGRHSDVLRQSLAQQIGETADLSSSEQLAALDGLMGNVSHGELESMARRAVEQSTDPSSTAAYTALALYSAGIYEAAANLAEVALDSDQRNPVAYAVLAAAKLQTGDVVAAGTALDGYLQWVSDPSDLGGDLLSAFLAAGESAAAEPLLSALSDVWNLGADGTATPEGWLLIMRAYANAGAAAEGLVYVEAHRPEIRAFPAGIGNPEPLAALLGSAGEPAAAEAVLRDDLVYGESAATLYALSDLLAASSGDATESARLHGRARALGIQAILDHPNPAGLPVERRQQVHRISILRGQSFSD